MNKKLIAAAVSAAIVAPVAAYGEVTVYGRINNAIDLNDLDDRADADSKTNVSSVSSRFGIKYNKEIGNGLSAHGRYEFRTVTDKEQPGIDDIRIATVGLSGPFGRIDVGNQWSSYFNTFGTLVSPTYSLGYYIYSSAGGGPFRSSNTIKYSNSFGPVYAELDIRLNDDSDPEGGGVAEKLRGDGVGLGLSWAISDSFTLAVAYDNEDDDAGDLETDRIGIGAKANFGGGYWLSVGWQNIEVDDDGAVAGKDIDSTFIYGGGNFSENTNWLIGYSEADDDSSAFDDPEQLTWGVYHNIGGGLKIYYEAINVDWEGHTNSAGDARPYDGARHLIGMRVDF